MKNPEVLKLAKEAKKDERKLSKLIKFFQMTVQKRYGFYMSQTTVLDYDDFDVIVARVVWQQLSKLNKVDNWIGYTIGVINNTFKQEIKCVKQKLDIDYNYDCTPQNSKYSSRGQRGRYKKGECPSFEDTFFQIMPVYQENYLDEHYIYLVAELNKRLRRNREKQLLRLLVCFPRYTHRRLAEIMAVHETRVSQLLNIIRGETKIILETL